MVGVLGSVIIIIPLPKDKNMWELVVEDE